MNLVEKLIKLDQESPRKILIIGDGMTDMYVHGHMEECQDGCQKFVTKEEFIVPGGAGNAERSLSHWNCKTKLIWQPGCNEKGVMKVRFLVDDKIVYRWDNDKISYDLDLMRREALTILQDWEPDGVLLSDYDKGMLTPEFMRQVIDICKEKSIPCVADAKRNSDLYRGVIVKGNKDWYDKGGVADIITRGAYSPTLNTRNFFNEYDYVCRELPKVTCINHVGAGDCFAAHLTLALVHRFSLKDSAAIAHSAGRVYVQYRHNRPPKLEEIVRDMNGEVVNPL